MWHEDPASTFRGMCPLNRVQAEAMARFLYRRRIQGEEDYLCLDNCCVIPDETTTLAIRRLLPSCDIVIELGAGIGMLHMTMEALGVMGDMRYISVDANKGLANVSGGIVLCKDNLEAIQEFRPRALVCSWPWPEFDLVDTVMSDRCTSVQMIVVIGPWLGLQSGKLQAGRAVEENLPNGWQYELVPDIIPVDVHMKHQASLVYVLTRHKKGQKF